MAGIISTMSKNIYGFYYHNILGNRRMRYDIDEVLARRQIWVDALYYCDINKTTQRLHERIEHTSDNGKSVKESFCTLGVGARLFGDPAVDEDGDPVAPFLVLGGSDSTAITTVRPVSYRTSDGNFDDETLGVAPDNVWLGLGLRDSVGEFDEAIHHIKPDGTEIAPISIAELNDSSGLSFMGIAEFIVQHQMRIFDPDTVSPDHLVSISKTRPKWTIDHELFVVVNLSSGARPGDRIMKQESK